MIDPDLLNVWNERRQALGGRALDDKTAMIWYGIVQSYHDVDYIPQSVRQIYYKVEGYGIVPKDETGYRRVQRQVLNMRRAGCLRYDLVTDGTRWVHGPTTHNDIEAFLENSRKTYRRDLWLSQAVNVHIWLEKEALYGVIGAVTEDYDIPVMVSRGFASESYLYSVAEAITASNKPTYVYTMYDFDRAGQLAADHIRAKLVDFGAAFHFGRLALLPDQIAAYNLSTRKPKRTDIRNGWQYPYCCELDALPANVLRALVKDAIERHIDHRALEETKRIERLERETFTEVIRNMGLVPH